MKRQSRRSYIKATSAVAIAAALVLGGCAGSGSGGSDHDPEDFSEIVTGGTLNYRAAGGTRSLDPADTTGYGLAIPIRTLVDSLVFNDIDGSFHPWLATEWEFNEDATYYRFTLRDDVTFSNGEELNAEAVAASYQTLQDQGARYATANASIGALNRIETPEEYVVEFYFDQPNASFLQATSTTVLGIVAPETSALGFDERAQGLTIIGSGPFVATENRNEEGYRLERRDDYNWGPQVPGFEEFTQGPAFLDAIEVHHISDNSIAAAELRSGGLQALHNTEPADKNDFASSDYITIRREPLPGAALGFIINPQHPALQELDVRRALSLALDNDEVLDRASAIDQPPLNVLSTSNPFFPGPSDKIETDPAEAVRLLDEAGWEIGSDGIREKDGVRLSFELIYSASTISHEPNLAVVQSQWRELGIELIFGSLTGPELNARQAAFDYGFKWGSGTRPDVDVLRANFGGIDDDLDDLFSQIRAETDFETRKALGAEAADLILERQYIIPLYDFIQPIAFRNEVKFPLFEASQIPWLAAAWIQE